MTPGKLGIFMRLKSLPLRLIQAISRLGSPGMPLIQQPPGGAPAGPGRPVTVVFDEHRALLACLSQPANRPDGDALRSLHNFAQFARQHPIPASGNNIT